MSDLRWFSSAGVSNELADPKRYAGRKAVMRFRDQDGGPWAAETGTGSWYQQVGGQWRGASPPPRLEGPVELPLAGWPAEADRRPDQERPPDSAIQFIEQSVDAVRASYEGGRLTSGAAEALLIRFFLVDREGAVWTLGARTGVWYRCRGGRWQASRSAPDLAMLIDGAYGTSGDRIEAVDQGIAQLFAGDTLLPEPITDPWEPDR